jgi:hypothetical protein
MSVTQVSAHTFEIGGMGASVPEPAEFEQQLTPAATAKSQPKAIKSSPEQPGARLDTRALLAQLKTRLRDVKREITRLRGLERERDQLQRLIKAANTELDNVRRLRAAG